MLSVSMTPERWQRLQTLFDQALALDAEARETFAITECEGDASLREQLLALLKASGGDDHFDQRVDAAIASTIQRNAELQHGQSIGRYKIVNLLGRGGMGAVYLAERADKEFEQRVAIKIVNEGALSQRIVARLKSERQILANLNHPNIARLLDGGATDEGIPYLTMEYVDGDRIDHYCKSKQLDIEERLALFQQVCAAVQYAHQQLIVHRDIKPSNILVTAERVVKLLDFGIAKLVDPNAADELGLTRVHERVLTPENASPEQVRGEPVSTASDIYALGVLLYELLTDLRPFDFTGKPFAQIEKAICDEMPTKPSDKAKNPALRGDLDTIVLKAMHKEPARRYVTANALAEDINSFLSNRTITARPDSVTYRTGKFWQRNRWSVSSVAVVLLAVVALTVFYTVRLSHALDVAEREAQKSRLVSDYLVDMFKSASPDVSQGKAITAIDLLHKGEATLDNKIAMHPEVQAELADVMGTSYFALGENDAALRLFSKAVSLQKNAGPKSEPQYARALASLGEVETQVNDTVGAARDIQEALRLQESNAQTQPLDKAHTLLLLSQNYTQQNFFDKALDSVERARRIVEAQHAQDSIIGADVATLLANLRSEQTDYKNAERLFREATAIRERLLGRRHPDTLNSKEGLGVVLRRSGRFRDALPILEQVLDDKRAVLGPDHPDLAVALTLVGSVLVQLGDYQRAEVILRDSIRIARDKMGTENRQYGAALRSMANNEFFRGNYKTAEAFFGQALQVEAKTLPPGDQELQRITMMLSASIMEQGRLAESDRLMTPVIEFFESHLNQKIMTGTVWIEAGRLRLLQNRIDDARRYLLRDVEVHKAAGDQMHPNNIRLLTVLAQLQLHEREYQDAAATSKQALDLAMVSTPDARAHNANLKSINGAARYLLGEREHGAAMVIESYGVIAKERKADDPMLREAKQRLELVSNRH